MEYLFPVLIFLALGLISAILLTVASKIFAVKVDERIEKIQSELPQANCGACGFAGCADYADAIVTKGASTTLCKPGGVQTCEKIALIMGQSADIFVAECAFVHCNGSCENTKRCFDFEGIHSSFFQR